ncbi:endonuclease NucS [Candidatus Woesearchaeota archaeon]|nr:endonuclease NucS [Candidatus Woesearchaeota archaeon]
MHDLSKYPILIEDALGRKECITLSCRCEVWYSGRAEAYLPMGDRLIIIKEDSTLLVHQPVGNNPINYMKNGSRHSMTYNGANLFLNSRNLELKEFLDVRIALVHFFNSYKLEDNQSIQIAGTEKDMSDMIYDQPGLIEDGFKPLSREEHTKYGFIDVFGYDKKGTLTVLECKRYVGDLKAVTQLRRYVEKIKESKGIKDVRGILACPKISPNALKMLQDWGYEYKSIEPPKYLERFNKAQKTLDFYEED